MKVWVKCRNLPIYWEMGYFHEWLFYSYYRNFGSKTLIIRILGIEITFYKRGKDVTQELINKLKTK